MVEHIYMHDFEDEQLPEQVASPFYDLVFELPLGAVAV